MPPQDLSSTSPNRSLWSRIRLRRSQRETQQTLQASPIQPLPLVNIPSPDSFEHPQHPPPQSFLRGNDGFRIILAALRVILYMIAIYLAQIYDFIFGDEETVYVTQAENVSGKGRPTSLYAATNTFSAEPEVSKIPSFAAKSGVIGAMFRWGLGIEPYVWVVNKHHEEITVVISRYGPVRLLSGGGINAGPTGGGLNIETITFVAPATSKVLTASEYDDRASRAAFPLWTRRNGFGVISIFRGKDKILSIENDRIPAGATAYFENKPDLDIIDYYGMRISRGPKWSGRPRIE